MYDLGRSQEAGASSGKGRERALVLVRLPRDVERLG